MVVDESILKEEKSLRSTSRLIILQVFRHEPVFI
jgi:hypothetical protein